MQDKNGTLDGIFNLPPLFWIYLPSFILTGKILQPLSQMNVNSGIGPPFQVHILVQRFMISINKLGDIIL